MSPPQKLVRLHVMSSISFQGWPTFEGFQYMSLRGCLVSLSWASMVHVPDSTFLARAHATSAAGAAPSAPTTITASTAPTARLTQPTPAPNRYFPYCTVKASACCWNALSFAGLLNEVHFLLLLHVFCSCTVLSYRREHWHLFPGPWNYCCMGPLIYTDRDILNHTLGLTLTAESCMSR